MELYAPTYYKHFECLCGACKSSCCIGWEIDIDSDTLNRYRTEDSELYERIKATIEDSSDGAHFRLDEGQRCPHLNREGLCDIILTLGEEALCHICREHPRYYNPLCDSVEVGLGIACPEAARLILETEYSFFLQKTDYPIPRLIYPVEDAEREEWIYKAVFTCLCRMLDEGESTEAILSALLHLGLWADDAQYFSHLDPPPKDGFAVLSSDSLIRDYISIIEGAFPLLETLEDSLIPRILEATRKISDNSQPITENLSGGGRVYISRLLFYFTHRYLPGAILYSGWAERLLLSGALAMALYFLSFSEGAALTDTAVVFSQSIEYSTENIDRLLDYLTDRFF